MDNNEMCNQLFALKLELSVSWTDMAHKIGISFVTLKKFLEFKDVQPSSTRRIKEFLKNNKIDMSILDKRLKELEGKSNK